MSLGPQSRIVVSPSVYSRAFGEELVLLDFARGEYFGLDPIGAATFKELEAGAPVSRAIEAIVAAYDVSPDVAERDILSLVQQMQEQGLLTVV